MPLAPYATTDQNSRGRIYSIPEATDRNAFARDYTRVLHSQALRRLQHKTQVFSSTEGDLFRTRLTHSMEVEQISRSCARQLGLNEDLCAVLALGHDLGHAPFGHMGQDVLNSLLKEHGGFEHNHQALRIVDELESPYPEHHGLNLMFETREGLLKHCTQERARRLGEVARRHLDGRQPLLEAQVVDTSDAIAYVHADLEDAFLMGLLDCEEIKQAPGYREAMVRIQQKGVRYPEARDFQDANPEIRRRAQATVQSVVREMMRHSIDDMVAQSKLNIESANPKSPEDARIGPALVSFSPTQRKLHCALRKFSHENIYAHAHVVNVRKNEEKILRGLFQAYEKAPEEMDGYPLGKEENLYRRLADHLSGLTDLRAHKEYERILRDRPELIEEQRTRRMALK